MGSISFNKQNNRLKRQLPGIDHNVALVFYSNTLPSGFGANDRIKAIADLDAAEALGITAGGADDLMLKLMHYHIAELFRINPDAVLWVGVYSVPAGTHTFAEVGLVRQFSAGKITKVGVWTPKQYIEAHIALLQTQYADSFEMFSMHEIFYAPNLVGVTDANLPNLAALTSPNVHVCIAQDGGATGKALYDAIAAAAAAASTTGHSVGCIGAIIGAASLARVHENIGWVEKFDMAVSGGELDIPALSNGTQVSALANNIVKHKGTLDTKRLIFLKKFPANITGTYWNDSHGACPASSDYAYAEDNITMDKAIRGIYINLAPKINGPVLLDPSTGRLSGDYVQFLQLEAGKALEQMEKDGELSGYVVEIDANQDVASTSQIVVNVTNTKVGVSRELIVNIGY